MTCNWLHNLDTDAWATDCGHTVTAINGKSPDACGMKFCGYCGELVAWDGVEPRREFKFASFRQLTPPEVKSYLTNWEFHETTEGVFAHNGSTFTVTDETLTLNHRDGERVLFRFPLDDFDYMVLSGLIIAIVNDDPISCPAISNAIFQRLGIFN